MQTPVAKKIVTELEKDMDIFETNRNKLTQPDEGLKKYASPEGQQQYQLDFDRWSKKIVEMTGFGGKGKSKSVHESNILLNIDIDAICCVDAPGTTLSPSVLSPRDKLKAALSPQRTAKQTLRDKSCKEAFETIFKIESALGTLQTKDEEFERQANNRLMFETRGMMELQALQKSRIGTENQSASGTVKSCVPALNKIAVRPCDDDRLVSSFHFTETFHICLQAMDLTPNASSYLFWGLGLLPTMSYVSRELGTTQVFNFATRGSTGKPGARTIDQQSTVRKGTIACLLVH